MVRTFLQVDLKQAESRFVAMDSADDALIAALTDPTRDIHSEVAVEICLALGYDPLAEQADKENWKKKWRQLGKKAGHGANYAMKAATFAESCLKEMGLVLTLKQADAILEAYHRLFGGIRRWHKQLRDTVYRERKLTTPMGRVRYFYGRMDDATYREAYAYRPQSTVPDITCSLMLRLLALRNVGLPDFWLHLQVHDSLILSCAPHAVAPLADFMLDLSNWHPRIELTAGLLRIPVSIEHGPNLGSMEEYGT